MESREGKEETSYVSLASQTAVRCRMKAYRGVQPFGISGLHWKKKSCFGPHIKYRNTNENKKKSHNVLSKCMILCWTVGGLRAAAWAPLQEHTPPEVG